MEREVVKTNNGSSNNRERVGGGEALYRGSPPEARTTSDFVLQWGNRKRPRCMKIQVKDESAPVQRTTVRVDRRVVRADKETPNQQTAAAVAATTTNNGNGYFNLRQRPASPSAPPPPHRVLRNSEAMRGQSNGVRGLSSPDRGEHKAQDRKGNNHHNNDSNGGGGGGASNSTETAHDSKKGGSSSGSEAVAAVWPPKFVIALTNKEKEEDFMAIKGSKLPQRPKKRAKFIQRTLNLVSPGAWLCDLTLERYEVREKKISKKRPRGLKAMGNMDSDSE
ncbi:uncharacterized protein LOC131150629 [Malania oleifera]|uniref:uncharacterized protein LOC131150629 n=1 Tax=Malania oleifera TaxID=397392 RepID=UPI0025AE50F7|nr:uncharacterized protein LOC131150629 [Malania oleifera]XP_057957459.1 uncharacterized protein LOC131150629 [Malania oleifera]